MATGYGSETAGDFGDFIEKAETKAVGRALNALGYGTQFALDDGEALADGPVDPGGGGVPGDFATRRGRPVVARGGGAGEGSVAHLNQPATDKQTKFIQAIARESGLDEGALDGELRALYDGGMGELTRRDASTFIERLQARRADAAPRRVAPAPPRHVAPAPPPQPSPHSIQSDTKQPNDGDGDAAAFAAQIAWSDVQAPWVSRVLRASDGRNLEHMRGALPKDTHGRPDQMLLDLLALRLGEV